MLFRQGWKIPHFRMFSKKSLKFSRKRLVNFYTPLQLPPFSLSASLSLNSFTTYILETCERECMCLPRFCLVDGNCLSVCLFIVRQFRPYCSSTLRNSLKTRDHLTSFRIGILSSLIAIVTTSFSVRFHLFR